MDKTFALCFAYNATAALVGSTVFAVAVTIVGLCVSWSGGRRDLPPSPGVDAVFWFRPCVMYTPIVYFGMLFHWQTIRGVLLQRLSLVGKTLVFLDKLCINQQDEEAKQQGILGLAAFIKSSNRMVVLWSPTYFTRLWCTYELATWFRFGKKADAIVLLPVSLPKCIILSTLSWTCLAEFGRSNGFLKLQEASTALKFVLIVLTTTGVTLVLQKLQMDVHSLGEQLLKFSMVEAECFCCTHDHEHPETHAKLPCDRKLVNNTLEEWYGHAEDVSARQSIESTDYMSCFDEGVRTLLRQRVLSVVSSQMLQLKYTEIVHMVLPLIWDTMDTMIVQWDADLPLPQAADTFADSLLFPLFTFPCALLLVCRFMAWRTCHASGIVRRLLLAVFFWAPMLTLLLVGLYMPIRFSDERWYRALWWVLKIGLLCFLRRPSRCLASAKSSSDRPGVAAAVTTALPSPGNDQPDPRAINSIDSCPEDCDILSTCSL
eukprot:TRINITY_DN17969_c0_g1_i15.p1 TRINITY_DN17969_c0_g1~~TRINITY_DN17969_c0_g1_i15.p1  ORF type:complete len:487 (+),score=14.75 TRINITY_DN17969_c0_g1_i15:679-2139(+)